MSVENHKQNDNSSSCKDGKYNRRSCIRVLLVTVLHLQRISEFSLLILKKNKVFIFVKGWLRKFLSMTEPKTYVPPVMVYNTWTHENAYLEEQKPLEGFCRIYDIALIRGEDLSSSATAFAHYSTAEYRMKWLWVFWLMILSVEDKQNGAWSISLSENTNPPLYRKIIRSIALKKCGRSKKPDDNLVKKWVSAGLRFNLKEQQDILNMIDVLKCKDTKEQEEKAKKTKGKAAAPAVVRGDGPLASYTVLLNLSFKYDKRIGDPVPGYPELSGPQTNPYRDTIDTSFEVIDEECNLLTSGGLELLNKAFKKKIVPKVRLLSTQIPHKDDPDNIVGYLFQFVVYDPSWNPGKTFNIMKEGKNVIDKIFPDYKNFPTTHFPTTDFADLKYRQILSKLQNLKASLDINSDIFGTNDFADYSSPMHVSHILNYQHALSRLKAAGGEPDLLDAILQKRKNAVNDGRLGPYLPDTKTFCFDPERIFWYHPEQLGFIEYYLPGVKAHDPTVIDPSRHNPSTLIRLAKENQMLSRRFVYEKCPEIAKEQNSSNQLQQLHREARVARQRLSEICPADQIEIFRKFHNLYLEHGSDWRLYVTTDQDMDDLDQYEVHRQKSREIRNMFLERFTDLCDLEGYVDNLPIPDPMKAMLRWYANFSETSFKNMSFEVYLVDGKMGFFGNTVMTLVDGLLNYHRLSQPRITVLLEGLESVYEVRWNTEDRLKFNFIVTGKHAAGKSKHTVDMGKVLFIPGTHTTQDKQTDAADTVEEDVLMMMRLSDEIEDYCINATAAKNKPQLARQKQTALTTGKLSSRVYEQQVDKNGRTKRVARVFQTRLDYVEGGCSNQPMSEPTPITSRFFVTTMADVTAENDVTQMNNFTPEQLGFQNQFTERFRRNQFILAITQQAMGVMGIYPEPEMQLFDDVIGRVKKNLWFWTGSTTNITRTITRMRCIAIIYVIRMAQHYTWDIRGAPHFKQPFKVEHLKTLERYLYVTPDIILFVLTLLCEDLIDEPAANVMRAMLIRAKLQNYVDEDTLSFDPYDVYCRDTKNEVKFRTVKLRYDENSSKNVMAVDLNYIQFDESKGALAKELVSLTSPRLEPNQIEAVLDRLKKKSFIPRVGAKKRNGFALVEESELLQHKYVKTRKPELCITSYKKELIEFGNVCEKRYRRAAFSRFTDLPAPIGEMTDADLENFQTKNLKHVTHGITLFYLHSEIGQIPSKEFETVVQDHIMKRDIETIATHDLSRLLNAFSDVTRSASETLSVQLRKLNVSAGQIDLLLHALDEGYFGVAEETYIRQPYGVNADALDMLNGQRFYDVNDTTVKDPIAIPFVKFSYKPDRVYFSPLGLALMDRRAVLDAWKEAVFSPSFDDGKYMLGWATRETTKALDVENISEHQINTFVSEYDKVAHKLGHIPRSQGVPFVRSNFDNPIAEMAVCGPEHIPKRRKVEAVEVIKDLGYESALRQHVKAGFRIDEPVHDPKYLKQRYFDAGGKTGQGDYPHHTVNQVKRAIEDQLIASLETELTTARDVVRLAQTKK